MLRVGAVIARVRRASIAEEAGLGPGDLITAIDGKPVRDLVDYRFLTAGEEIALQVVKASGEEWLLEVEKDYDDDLGIEFDETVFDRLRTCGNNCLFCFVHQMPRGMRQTLYIKDDDYRLSFLHGSYITMGNLSEEDLDRILEQRLSPLYVSVHTTEDDLRQRLMGTPRAGGIMERLRRLAAGRIQFQTQIVLCPGLNDGPHLDRTIQDLAGLYPNVLSIAAVPVGLTSHREGLYPLRPYIGPEAAAIIEQVEAWQDKFRSRLGTALVFAADEFYCLADRPVPPAGEYEGFPQLENGVGLIRVLLDEFAEVEPRLPEVLEGSRRVTAVTGVSAFPTIKQVVDRLSRIKGLTIDLVRAENDFFGPTVTVSGLLTGRDIVNSLQERKALDGLDLGDAVLIPASCVRQGEPVLLDDLTLAEMSSILGRPVETVGISGEEIARAFTGQSLQPAGGRSPSRRGAVKGRTGVGTRGTHRRREGGTKP